jgi:hypothetical protein
MHLGNTAVKGQFGSQNRTCGPRIGGQVLVRVAIAVCAHDPDFLATQLRSKGLER